MSKFQRKHFKNDREVKPNELTSSEDDITSDSQDQATPRC